ncbi:MAG: DNA recombination protein RmuC [Clostridia bacterium]|nr:DNA recombination protein RmuC [Clostridia bacterium]
MTAVQSEIGQGQRAQLASMLETVGQLDRRVEQMRQATAGAIDKLREENQTQLTEMRRTVDERLEESLEKRLTESFAQVSRRLEQVWRGLGEMQSLAAGVGDLKKVLTNVKSRGIWGEMQLGALLSAMLSPGQYEENVSIVPGSQERVEYAIRLPGREGGEILLPIDSKFPQEDYLRLQEAADAGDKAKLEECRRALRQRLRTEAKRIATKYIHPPYSTDFAVMFLPVEGLYAEAVRETGLMEELQRDWRVTVTGPTTCTALLNALQMGFRTLAIEQRTGEVWRLLGEVRTDFGRFAETLEKTRQRLQQASESIDTAVSRSQTIQRRLNAMEAFPENPEARLDEKNAEED